MHERRAVERYAIRGKGHADGGKRHEGRAITVRRPGVKARCDATPGYSSFCSMRACSASACRHVRRGPGRISSMPRRFVRAGDVPEPVRGVRAPPTPDTRGRAQRRGRVPGWPRARSPLDRSSCPRRTSASAPTSLSLSDATCRNSRSASPGRPSSTYSRASPSRRTPRADRRGSSR